MTRTPAEPFEPFSTFVQLRQGGGATPIAWTRTPRSLAAASATLCSRASLASTARDWLERRSAGARAAKAASAP